MTDAELEAIRARIVTDNVPSLVKAPADRRALRHYVDELRSRLAEAEKDATRSRHEWQRECEDTDLLLQGMGLCPSEYRSECGSLLLARIRHKMGHIGLRLDETLARLAEAETSNDQTQRLWDEAERRLVEAEALLREAKRDLRIAAKCMNPAAPVFRQFNDTADRIDTFLAGKP